MNVWMFIAGTFILLLVWDVLHNDGRRTQAIYREVEQTVTAVFP